MYNPKYLWRTVPINSHEHYLTRKKVQSDWYEIPRYFVLIHEFAFISHNCLHFYIIACSIVLRPHVDEVFIAVLTT